MLACAWLSAGALGRPLQPGRPDGAEPAHGSAAVGQPESANQPVPTDRTWPTDAAPGAPDALLPAPSDPTEQTDGDREAPMTPETPTATPVTPTATPETPTATPVTPTATPETPTATPETPTATPETPTATPETPTATPETPTATPETPTATPETPTPTPVTPTPTPVCSGNTVDSYEADNTYAQAGVISTDGVPQCHDNTNPVSEEDWVTFGAVSGHAYEIGTRLLNDINQSDAAANDTLLYLYGTDGTTQLAFNDDVGYTTWYQGYYYYRESRINWTAPTDGWYYVQELQWGPTAGNSIRDYHWYELWVLDVDAPTPESPAETPASPEAIAPMSEPTEEPVVTTETATEEPAEATETPTPDP
jgi:hypothetical protein